MAEKLSEIVNLPTMYIHVCIHSCTHTNTHTHKHTHTEFKSHENQMENNFDVRTLTISDSFVDVDSFSVDMGLH